MAVRSGPQYMTLRLRIVSDHRRALRERSSVAFGAEGGTIGRSAENDWILPDPLRYVSARHARIHFRNGRYLLEDVSTNGIYVNDDEQPLAKGSGSGHPLRNGDIIRIGDYQIVAALEAAAPRADAGAAVAEDQVPTSINELRALGRSTAQTDIGAPLNLDELLVAQEVRTHARLDTDAPPARSSSGGAIPILGVSRAAATRETRSTSPAGVDPRDGLRAFCRGAGIDAAELPEGADTRMLHLAGQLLRESLVGFRELDRRTRETRERYRIDLAQEPDDPCTRLSRSTVEELLVERFCQHERGQVDGVAWLRAVLTAERTHEGALEHATRAALVEILGRLDPAELEARFERAARRGQGRPADRAQYWDLFTTFYRNLIEMPADHLPHTFVEAFASAYREKVRRPGN